MEESECKVSTEDTSTLLKNLDENCRTVENLALNIVNNQHIPLLNSISCMTRNDCKLLLNKCSLCQNMIDQSVLLISITDFVSCVCANNETFPISVTKRDKNSIKPLLCLLSNYWTKFFSKLAVKDMNVTQISTLITLIKGCQDRMPNTSYKEIMETILKMAQKAFTLLNKCHVPESVESDKLMKPSLKENSVHLTKNIPMKVQKFVRNEDNKPESTSNTTAKSYVNASCDKKKLKNHSFDKKINSNSSTKKAPTKVLSIAEANNTESKTNATDKSYANASCDKKKLKNHSFDLKYSVNLTKKAPMNVLAKTEGKSNAKDTPYRNASYDKKKLKNHSFDITRYILKPCENNVKEPSIEQKSSVTLKRKYDTLTENGPSNLIEEMKDCNNLTVEVIEPPNKKQCLTADYVDGKVNAFKRLMMTQKQREKKTL